MAAPKPGGMLFRGNLQGEPKPAGRLTEPSTRVSGINRTVRRSRIPSGAGRGLFALAMAERAERDPGDRAQQGAASFQSGDLIIHNARQR
jgi:hypothetical protein